MQQLTNQTFPVTIGLDLGAKSTQCAIFGEGGQRVEERAVTTNREQVTALLSRFPGARIVMEASTASRWIHNLAVEHGHEVIVANPRSIPLITASVKKCDRNDARLLGELGQLRPDLLSPVRLREDHYQAVRALLFARMQLVKQRSTLVTFVKSEVRVLGFRLPACGTKVFAKKCRKEIPVPIRSAMDPIVDTIECLCVGIESYDLKIEELSRKEYPETGVLRQVHGVGPLVALAFVSTVGDPERFKKSRTIGAYLGLVPRIRQSGKSNPALGITKCGDRYMRSLLVSAATRILAPSGPDSDLRRYGERIIGDGGRRARARARIAVARKLGVVLHRLLCTGEVYEPLRNSAEGTAEAA